MSSSPTTAWCFKQQHRRRYFANLQNTKPSIISSIVNTRNTLQYHTNPCLKHWIFLQANVYWNLCNVFSSLHNVRSIFLKIFNYNSASNFISGVTSLLYKGIWACYSNDKEPHKRGPFNQTTNQVVHRKYFRPTNIHLILGQYTEWNLPRLFGTAPWPQHKLKAYRFSYFRKFLFCVRSPFMDRHGPLCGNIVVTVNAYMYSDWLIWALQFWYAVISYKPI